MTTIARTLYAASAPGHEPPAPGLVDRLLDACSVSVHGGDPGIPRLPLELVSYARGRERFVLEYPQGFRVSVTPSFEPSGFCIRNIAGLDGHDKRRVLGILTRILGASVS